MVKSNPTENFRRLLTAAHDAQPPAPGPHIADDDGLLSRAESGALTPEDRQRWVDHLADCRECREIIAEMVRSGALAIPEVDEVTNQIIDTPANPIAAPIQARSPWVTYSLAGLVVAAGLMIAVGYFGNRPAGADGELALAEQDLGAKRYESAMNRAEKALASSPSAETKRSANRILETAAYGQAQTELKAGRFEEVGKIVARASRQEKGSARLANLRFQASRKIPDPASLAMAGSLRKYGFDLEGDSVTKAIPILTPEIERLKVELAAGVRDYPDQIEWRLNYGQFLLELNQAKAAEEQFAAAEKIDSANFLAQLGLGLAALHQEKFAEGLKHFESALQIDPNNVEAHLNAAACCVQLQRREDAEKHWKQAVAATTDPKLRDEIEKLIGVRKP